MPVSTLVHHWIARVKIQVCVFMKRTAAGDLYLRSPILDFAHCDRFMSNLRHCVMRQDAEFQNRWDVLHKGNEVQLLQFISLHGASRMKPIRSSVSRSQDRSISFGAIPEIFCPQRPRGAALEPNLERIANVVSRARSWYRASNSSEGKTFVRVTESS